MVEIDAGIGKGEMNIWNMRRTDQECERIDARSLAFFCCVNHVNGVCW